MFLDPYRERKCTVLTVSSLFFMLNTVVRVVTSRLLGAVEQFIAVQMAEQFMFVVEFEWLKKSIAGPSSILL